ncbi:MAG: aminotransferase class III-fold pyridoxal phosphate-dependent enzyme [Pseudomonadota bacterium]
MLTRPQAAPIEVPAIEKPDLITVDGAKSMPLSEMTSLFVQHLNPGQLHFMKLLGFDKIKVVRAEGMHYETEDGTKILDFFGGFGSLAFGHNHPRILGARTAFADEKRHEIAMAFLSQYAAALAKNLAAVSPDDLDMVFLGSSGSEAMEAALKLAERASGKKNVKVVYAQNAFHGKTKGVLSITDSPLYQAKFPLVENVVKVPFGDLDAIRAAVKADPDIGVIVLETVQGGGGIVGAPTEFWQGLRKFCDETGILWVADEVQCGLGRTGRFYAFEHHGVVPDITALAKSLGGGKCAMAAMIAKRDVYMKAYGKPKDALIHGPATFGGIGEACVTAIEGLNILYDEQLMENATRTGEHLLARLREIQAKYPKLIKDVRGQGLMIGLELQDMSRAMPLAVRPMLSVLDDKLKGSLAGFLGAALLREHQILVAFTEYNRNVIRLEPPLIASIRDADTFADALDATLSGGVMGLVKGFLASKR